MPTKDPRTDVLSLSRQELTRFVEEELGAKSFRAKQIWRWLHLQAVRSFDEMTDLPKELRTQLAEKACITGLQLLEDHTSGDGTRKLVLETWDKHRIESVLIPSRDTGLDDEEEDADIEQSIFAAGQAPKRPRMTLCFSTQVGCAMDCKFCYTASLGLARSLSAGEITDQVRYAKQVSGPDQPITNLVAMGMGEPLSNLPNLLSAIEALTAPDGFAFGAKRITVSTVGLVPQMKKLGEASRVNLAVSLTGTTDALRDKLMPINQKFPLAELLQACREYPLPKGRRITFEYVLLGGVNDSLEDAERLAKILRGIPAKVNLLPFNVHERSPFVRPSDETVDRFQRVLLRYGYATSIRTSRGRDVTAACGQLGHNASIDVPTSKIFQGRVKTSSFSA